MEQFGDTSFQYHKAAAQFWGVLVLQLSDSVVLPFDYRDTTPKLQEYLESARSLLNISNANMIPALLNPIQQAINHYSDASQELQERVESASNTELNQILFTAERSFLYENGLPNRPWYKHMIQAPGLFSGYGADSFPGLTQSIKDQDWETAATYSNVISATIINVANFMMEEPSEPSSKIWIAIVVVVVVLVLIGAGIGIYYYRRRRGAYYEKLQSPEYKRAIASMYE